MATINFALIFAFIFNILILQTSSLKQGDICHFNETNGVCKVKRFCIAARIDEKKNMTVHYCNKLRRIVCCKDAMLAFENVPKVKECPKMSSDFVKVEKNGRKAWDYCIDVIEHIYTCIPSPAAILSAEKIRLDLCAHTATPLIVGGTEANVNEFPHMAHLGFLDDANIIQWSCGGSLISDRWVLTAGHCTHDIKNDRDLTHVKLGDSKIYSVDNITAHPSYNFFKKYNDIAVVRLNITVIFSSSVIPACLHTGEVVNDSKYLATGWGDTSNDGSASKNLMKVILEKFTSEECKLSYTNSKRMINGIDNVTQFCAGHHTEEKDTCQGDSGGPIQIYNDHSVYCTYLIMGVTSFGKECGTTGIPGVYTRVSVFVPWIESIVWN